MPALPEAATRIRELGLKDRQRSDEELHESVVRRTTQTIDERRGQAVPFQIGVMAADSVRRLVRRSIPR